MRPVTGAWSRVAGALILLTGIMLSLDQAPAIQSMLGGVAAGTARSTAAILSWLSMEAMQDGIYVSHPDGFAYAIDWSCTGLIPLSFLGVAIAFFPAAPRRRFIGFVLSLPYVLGINQIRLISLFHIGVTHAQAFDFVHEVLWQCLMVVFIGGFWILWIRGSMQENRGAARAQPMA